MRATREHGAACLPVTIWETLLAVIIVVILASSGLSWFYFAGLILLLISMPEIANLKRKREEEENIDDRKRKRENGAFEDLEDVGAEGKGENNESAGEEVKFDALANFRDVLDNISLKQLPELAAKLRAVQEKATSSVSCVIHDQVLSGSNNILWRIDFADGVKWLLKVGAVATIDKFDESVAKALDSEVQTMRLVSSYASIIIGNAPNYQNHLE